MFYGGIGDFRRDPSCRCFVVRLRRYTAVCPVPQRLVATYLTSFVLHGKEWGKGGFSGLLEVGRRLRDLEHRTDTPRTANSDSTRAPVRSPLFHRASDVMTGSGEAVPASSGIAFNHRVSDQFRDPPVAGQANRRRGLTQPPQCFYFVMGRVNLSVAVTCGSRSGCSFERMV